MMLSSGLCRPSVFALPAVVAEAEAIGRTLPLPEPPRPRCD
jgi:hypothetical protein